jgi:hypothetical protein
MPNLCIWFSRLDISSMVQQENLMFNLSLNLGATIIQILSIKVRNEKYLKIKTSVEFC